jgi:Family of unknown function (DUF6476)
MLKIAVVVMGVLIVVGVVVLVVVLTQRVGTLVSRGVTAPIVLDEPAGTHIAGVSALPDRLALTLQGGGPDRVVVVDSRSGRVLGRVSLAH